MLIINQMQKFSLVLFYVILINKTLADSISLLPYVFDLAFVNENWHMSFLNSDGTTPYSINFKELPSWVAQKNNMLYGTPASIGTWLIKIDFKTSNRSTAQNRQMIIRVVNNYDGNVSNLWALQGPSAYSQTNRQIRIIPNMDNYGKIIKFIAEGGSGTYSWNFFNMPDGAYANESTVVGTAVSAGRYVIRVQCTDNNNQVGSIFYVLIIQTALQNEFSYGQQDLTRFSEILDEKLNTAKQLQQLVNKFAITNSTLHDSKVASAKANLTLQTALKNDNLTQLINDLLDYQHELDHYFTYLKTTKAESAANLTFAQSEQEKSQQALGIVIQSIHQLQSKRDQIFRKSGPYQDIVDGYANNPKISITDAQKMLEGFNTNLTVILDNITKLQEQLTVLLRFQRINSTRLRNSQAIDRQVDEYMNQTISLLSQIQTNLSKLQPQDQSNKKAVLAAKMSQQASLLKYLQSLQQYKSTTKQLYQVQMLKRQADYEQLSYYVQQLQQYQSLTRSIKHIDCALPRAITPLVYGYERIVKQSSNNAVLYSGIRIQNWCGGGQFAKWAGYYNQQISLVGYL